MGWLNAVPEIALWIGISLAGWKVLQKAKIPAAAILGALLFVAVANVLSVSFYVPVLLRAGLSVSVGIIVGVRFNLKIDKQLYKHLILSCCWIIITGLIIGLILIGLGVKKDTAMLAALPGGLTELSFIALEFEVDPFQVTIFHTARMCTLLAIIPLIVKRIPQGGHPGRPAGVTINDSPVTGDWVALTVLAVIAATALHILNIPAGKMLGAMIAAAIYTGKKNIQPRLNKNLHGFIQALVGGSVGLGVTRESILYMPKLLIPVLILLILVMISYLCLSRTLEKVALMDRRTSLLAVAPGGLTPCIILASEMGADVSMVATFQIARYLFIILFAVLLGYLL